MMLAAWAVAFGWVQGGLPVEARKVREIGAPAPHTVTLSGAYRLSDVVEAARSQTGIRIEAAGLEADREVEVAWEAVPILQALDELSRGLGGGNLNLPQWERAQFQRDAGDDSEIIRWNVAAELPRAVAHSGSFRAEVSDVTIQTVENWAGRRETATIQIRLQSEPGSPPSAVGPFEVDEAVDDTGLAVAPLPGTQPRYGAWSEGVGPVGEDPEIVWSGRWSGHYARSQAVVSIRMPSPEARSLALLRGRVRVAYPMQEVMETVAVGSLVPGLERSFGTIRFHLREFTQEGTRLTLGFSIRGTQSDFGGISMPEFEWLDADGEEISGGMSGGGGGEGFRYDFDLPEGSSAAALRLRASVGRVTVELPFEFRDVPLPPPDEP